MKIKNHIRILLISLVVFMLLPTIALAALPPAVEPQWTNTKSVGCNIIISGSKGSISASITGYTGTTVQASVLFYKIKNGVRTDLYSASTPENNSLPIAAFTYAFTPESGATYYLYLSGVVSRNGINEEISDMDIETYP
jgi:hypothetical protein